MMNDLIFGVVLWKLLGRGSSSSAPAAPQNGSPAPAPAPTPTPTPTPAPAAPGAPTFPAALPVPSKPPTEPAAGRKRAVEIWIVRPDLAAQAQGVSGHFPPEVGVAALSMLEAQFPKGWQGATSATPAEAAQAKALLAQWRDGGVVFAGPKTLSGRRAFRMTTHPAAPGQPAAAPAAPTQPAVPATTIPEVLVTQAADASRLVTTVRKGEGLATIAKRLGRPANADSAKELIAWNVPDGPDAKWSSVALAKGGLKKAGRAGGLQPGDRLFVPAAWGPLDASRL